MKIEYVGLAPRKPAKDFFIELSTESVNGGLNVGLVISISSPEKAKGIRYDVHLGHIPAERLPNTRVNIRKIMAVTKGSPLEAIEYALARALEKRSFLEVALETDPMGVGEPERVSFTLTTTKPGVIISERKEWTTVERFFEISVPSEVLAPALF